MCFDVLIFNYISFKLHSIIIESNLIIDEHKQFLFSLKFNGNHSNIHFKSIIIIISFFISIILSFVIINDLWNLFILSQMVLIFIIIISLFIAKIRILLWVLILFQRFQALCDNIQKVQIILRKLVELASETEKLGKTSDKIGRLSIDICKNTAYEGIISFKVFKKATKFINQNLMYDIESDDTYSNLCDLPDELFNEIIDSENVTDFKKVKALVRLNRLQQSEYLRSFVFGLYLISKNETNNKEIFSQINLKISKINKILEHTNSKLNSLFEHNSTWWSYLNTNKTKHTFDINLSHLMSIIKTSKINLLNSALNLDDLASMISSEDSLKHKRKEILSRLDSIMEEIEICVKSISSSYQLIREKEAINVITVCDLLPKPNENQTIILDEVENNVIKDEVFESYYDPLINIEPISTFSDVEYEANRQKSAISSSLFNELKSALQPKQEEHRKREAEALGVPVEDIQWPLLEHLSKERSSTEKQTSSNANKLIIHETKDKEQIANEICKSEMSSIFAKIVADKSKEYRFGKDSENFGDFCESEDEN